MNPLGAAGEKHLSGFRVFFPEFKRFIRRRRLQAEKRRVGIQLFTARAIPGRPAPRRRF
jgi:hypothetical protein